MGAVNEIARRSGHAALAIGSVWSTYLHLAVFMLNVKNSFTPDMDPIKVFSSDATIWFFAFQPCASTNTTIHQLIFLFPVKRLHFDCG